MSAPSLLAAEEVACCEEEKWARIPEWPHEASTCGRARSVDRLGDDGIWRLGALLPPQEDKRPGKGYLYYDLRDGNRRRRIPAAVAVLEAHDRPRPGPGWEASHLYGIRADNHLDGLAWETRAANLARIALHAAERTVTDDCGDLSQERHACHRSQVTGGGGAMCDCHGESVTGDSLHGTGSLPPFQSLSSHFTSVQPLVHTLRTSFRSLRNRQAA